LLLSAVQQAFATAGHVEVVGLAVTPGEIVSAPSVMVIDGYAQAEGVEKAVSLLRTAFEHAPLLVVLAPGAELTERVIEAGADEVCELTSSSIASAYARATARRRAAARVTLALTKESESYRQARLRRHNELLQVLAQQLKEDDLPAQLRAITEAAALSMDVARIGVWLFDVDHTLIRCEDLFDVRTQAHESGLEIRAAAFPDYFHALEHERVIVANDARTHPATRKFAETYLQEHQIWSLLDAPIRVGGSVLGVICHEHVGEARVWTDEDESVAGSFADFVALAVEAHEHRRATEALRASAAQLEDARRIEAVGRLAGGVAHDFNNVITVVSSYAFLLAKKLERDDPLQGPVAEIGKAAERAADITRKLLALSRRDAVAPRVFDLNAVVRGMETFLRRLIGEHIELVLDLSREPVYMRADPGHIEQIVLNLVINARDASKPEGSRVALRTRRESMRVRGARPILLEVSDTGAGMSADVQSRIFEPFFTTKEAGHGSGLGLFTVWGVVNQLGGTIEVKSAPKQGSRFTLRFAEAEPVRDQLAPTIDRGALMGSELLLLVEDEPQVREVTALILRDLGYRVLVAVNFDDAIAHARQNPDIALLVSDIVMPRASGPVVAARLREIIPQLRILFISGYNREMLSAYDAALGPMLPKPFTVEQLGKKVREVLDSNGSRDVRTTLPDVARRGVTV
jgi:signal transduction histidine kinase/DNA-binding NarL/FixJ family response regulator